MTPAAEQCLTTLRRELRAASVARIGGFRPPDDPAASWFGAAVAAPGEGFPSWNGAPMFPLLQIRVADLPVISPALEGVALLTLFHAIGEHPFDRPHGEGWLIRAYTGTEGLQPLPPAAVPGTPRVFPIVWDAVTDDAPGWETAWGAFDMAPINADESARHAFFHDFHRYGGTKVGGYPTEIQHGNNLDGFVFQVASEPKANWQWGDSGIGYFCRDQDGVWSWSCQMY